MAIQRTGTEFVLKGMGTFINGLNRINKEYRNVAKAATQMGNKLEQATRTADRASQRRANSVKSLTIATDREKLAHHKMIAVLKKQDATYQQVTSAIIRYNSAVLALDRAEQEVEESTYRVVQAAKQKNEVLQNMGAASVSASAPLAALAGVATIMVGGFKMAAGVVKNFLALLGRIGRAAINLALTPLRKLASFVRDSLSVAFGVIFRDSIRAAIDALGRLWDAAIKVTSEFQVLEVRLQNLIARELRASGATTDIANSFTDAVKPAEELTRWITQLSLKSPFSVTDIANTTAFAMAMGFTSEESKSLTLSIGNFAAGMGLTSEKMESMIFNFGQMKAAGKVTGTEMRDLARGAFFPLIDVLDEAADIMGVVTDDITEFREAAAKGEVPIEVFFKAFQNVVGRDFPDAMERMKSTLQGVVTRFKNFAKTILGIELLGPVAKRFAEVASEALDKLLSPGVQRAARLIGTALPVAFDRMVAAGQQVWDAIKNLAAAFGILDVSAMDIGRAIGTVVGFFQKMASLVSQAINNVAQRVSDQMKGISGGMRQWGFNIIAQLAQGMADAAKLIIDVLIQIGQIITSWLKPGSPPKLLPHLDKWGAEAMTVYMKGWASADFSVFNDIADKVERFIRSMTENLLKNTDVVPTILDFRDRLAEAMEKVRNGAKFTSDMLKQVFSSFKNASPELKNYARLLLKVAEADAAVAKAQANLNAVTEKYDRILEPMKRRLEELNNATTDLDDTRRITQLRLILADVNASAGDKERARLEIERLLLQKQIRTVEQEKDVAVSAAEDKLKAAEEARAALQEQLDAAEALVDMQIKTNELIKEQLALLESLNKKLKGGAGGGLEIPPFDTTGLLEGVEDMGRQVSGMLDNMRVDWESIFDEIAAGVSDDIDEIIGKFDGLGDSIGELMGVWGGMGDLIKENRLSIAFERLGRAFEVVKDTIFQVWAGFLSMIGIDLSGLGLDIKTIGDAFVVLVEALTFGWILQLAILNGIITAIVTPVSNFAEAIVALLDAWVEFVQSVNFEEAKLNFLNLGLAILDVADGTAILEDIVSGFWSGVEEVTEASAGNIGTTLETFKSDTEQKFTDLADEVATNEGSIVPKMMNDMNTAVTNKTGELSGTIQTFTDETVDKFEKMSEKLIGKSVVPDMLDAILDEFGKKLGVEGLLDILDEELWNAYDKFDDILWNIFDEIIDPFVGAAIQMLASIATKLGEIITKAGLAGEALNSTGKSYGKGGSTDDAGRVGATTVSAPTVVGATASATTNNNHTLNMYTNSPASGVERSFRIMELMSA